MPRILYFSRDYTVHDHRFLTALAHTEHQVYYMRLERGRGQAEDRPLPPAIEIVHWAGGAAPARLQDGPRLLAGLKRVIGKLKPDLVQAGPLQRSAFLVALAGFRPLVSTSWGYDLIHDARRNSRWAWATRFTLRRSAVMVGDCSTIRQLAVSYGMPDERIVTFPWGVDLQHFQPASRNRSASRTFTLLSTRSWEPIYGVDVIARAFVAAAKQRIELRLVMLAGGSQAALLREIFSRGGVAGQVYMPGAVNQADLPRYYQSADLYISASHSDGTSISLLEALACGCPALVSDIPGNVEWVNPGENGWLFPDGDPDALAQAILHAVDQQALLDEMGRHARQVAETRGDWTKNFPRLLHAYQIALENPQ